MLVWYPVPIMGYTYPDMTCRLRASSSIDEITGCWNWLKMLDRDGYPRMKTGRRKNYDRRHAGAHRVSYEHYVGAIPPGMVIDHLCRNRGCINPEHLRVVYPRQNTLENSLAVTALNAQKTHCKRGHSLSGDNLVIVSDGSRQCGQCLKLRQKISNEKSRLAHANGPGRGGLNRRRTHCKHGHEFTPENTYHHINPNTGYALRQCKACVLASNERRRQRA